MPVFGTVGPVASFAADTEVVHIWLTPDSVNPPSAFGGAFVTSAVRLAQGRFRFTLTGFSPKAVLAAKAYGFNPSAADSRFATVGAISITPGTKTVQVDVGFRVIATGAFTEFSAVPGCHLSAELYFKMYPNRDCTGL